MWKKAEGRIKKPFGSEKRLGSLVNAVIMNHMRAFNIIVVAVLFSLSAFVRPNAKASETDQTLTRLENDCVQASIGRDTTTLQRLLAPSLVYTEDTTVMNRQELIRSILADRVTSGRNEDMKVHAYGGTAVVTGIMHLKGNGKEGAFDRRYRFTDTWILRNN